jgi:hypothetical protein
MSELAVGYAIGIVTGLAIGLIATRKREPWADLSDREKKIRIGFMATLGIFVIAGVVVLVMVI